MKYRVRYLIAGREDASEEVSSFEAAKLLAVNATEMGAAEIAEVIGPDGETKFRRPRTVRNAQGS